MRAVIQRVQEASVSVEGRVTGSIARGLLVLLAVGQEDGPEDVDFVRNKILHLRIFDDPEGRINLSVKDIGGSLLLVSQFTLYGNCRKGNRPSFSGAADPEKARSLYEELLALLRQEIPVEVGEFQANMKVSLVNDGPVTLILDSRTSRRGHDLA